MRNKIKNLKFIYVFYIVAILVLIGILSIYSIFGKTKGYIDDTTKNMYINYVYDISKNISDQIVESTSGDIYTTLRNDKKTVEELEKSLQLFVSSKYRYIYVVDKSSENANEFRFLLDASKDVDEKSEFEELYEPLNIKKFNQAYENKKEIYFTQEDAQDVWMTFIKPIVVDGKTQALLIIDFSMQGHLLINNSLLELDRVLKISIFLGLFIFFIIIFFAYIDNKRSKELIGFNEKLESNVKNEVEKNRQKDQQLIQQSRLAQMGEMISMIAHQWRQPLAAISSASAAIKLKSMLNKLDKDKAMELATNISNYSQHLSETIDDFRDFFKVNKDKNDVTYNELIESVLGIIEVSMENKNIILIKNLESKEIFHSYPNELKQVILNLMKNAEDILLEKKIQNPIITIHTQDNKLSICDNAGGVPEDIMEKIFDPYFSTKLEKNGSGLGLYMSKTIIQEHCDGDITVKNNEDGAIFTIALNSQKEK